MFSTYDNAHTPLSDICPVQYHIRFGTFMRKYALLYVEDTEAISVLSCTERIHIIRVLLLANPFPFSYVSIVLSPGLLEVQCFCPAAKKLGIEIVRFVERITKH
jgi:hypothetical protein